MSEHGAVREQTAGPYSDERIKAEQCRGGSLDRQIRPLALSFYPEMGSYFGKGDLDLPTSDEEGENVLRRKVGIRAEECLQWPEGAWITNEHPPERHNFAGGTIPKRRA